MDKDGENLTHSGNFVDVLRIPGQSLDKIENRENEKEHKYIKFKRLTVYQWIRGLTKIPNGKSDTRIEFPLLEAAQISIEHIRRRFKRSAIIVCAIALGITLLTHLLITNSIYSAFSDAGTQLEGYQFWLIIVSLIVCGIGLINANLIAMYERYQEIGTMKFLGALDQHVMKLFLVESSIFGLIGGLLGFTFGTITALLASSIQLGVNTLGIIPLMSVLQYLGLIVSAAVVLCVVSTLYPALRAAKLNPVEALRYQI